MSQCRVSYQGLPAVVMGCSFWLMVAIVLLFSLPTQGHEACYDDSWTYHSHTYSCFRLFRYSKTWTEARDYCSEIQLGSTYGVVTRLAKVDDEITDDFIRTLFPTTGWYVWIGLYYNDEKNAFRWDGYPNETLRYTASLWEQATLPYVITHIDGWRGMDSGRMYHFVCQHSAKTIGLVTCDHHVQTDVLNITCTSHNSPTEAQCEWTYNYEGDALVRAWTPARDPIHESHTENPGGNISYTTTCSVTFSNINAGIFMFQMKMYPDISGIDLSTNEQALTLGRLNISVDPPDIPQVIARGGKTLEASSTVVCVADETIDLVCNVHSGSPAVYSVTMSCEFPLSDSVDYYQLTVDGTDVVINRRVSRDMHGKNCSCIGNHLTGPVRSSPLTFFVVVCSS